MKTLCTGHRFAELHRTREEGRRGANGGLDPGRLPFTFGDLLRAGGRGVGVLNLQQISTFNPKALLCNGRWREPSLIDIHQIYKVAMKCLGTMT